MDSVVTFKDGEKREIKENSKMLLDSVGVRNLKELRTGLHSFSNRLRRMMV